MYPPSHTQDLFESKPRVSHVTDAYIAIRDADCAQLMADVRAQEGAPSPAAGASAYKVEVVNDGIMHFEAHPPQNRVFRMSAAGAVPVPSSFSTFLLESYIEPAKKCMLHVDRRLQSQANVPLETIIAEHLKEMTYLSPVFIPIELGSKGGHSLLRRGYGSGKNRVVFDEHKYPHLVFYIVPHSLREVGSIAGDVLSGYCGADPCSFVIELPEGVALASGAQEVAGGMTHWLSRIAGTRLDAFLVPDDWVR